MGDPEGPKSLAEKMVRSAAKPAKPIVIPVSKSSVVIRLVDELGEPLAKAIVSIKLPDGKFVKKNADENGVIRQELKEGQSLELTIEGIHEIGVGDGIKTASGQHRKHEAAKGAE